MPPLVPAHLLAVALLWGAGVIIPGPNFLAASRVAAASGRASGMAAVAGIGVGTALWGAAGAFGLQMAFRLAPLLYNALTLLGAAYLIWMGARMLIGSVGPAPPGPPRIAVGSAFRLGLLTSVSNPKSALFVASLFAAVMPNGATPSEGVGVIVEMVAISLGWYALVVAALTTRPAATAFARARRWIDRGAGVLFVGFGARLIWERAR